MTITPFVTDKIDKVKEFVIKLQTHERSNCCGYTHVLPEVTLWVIGLGCDRFGFPVRLYFPITLQIITLGQLLTC